jgi:hypothetical protein
MGSHLGATHGAEGEAERTKARGSIAESPRHLYVGARRARQVAGATSRACAHWTQQRRRQFLFHVHPFKNAKHQKVATKLIISKNRSCRGTIALKLSQRATYVLVKGLMGKS